MASRQLDDGFSADDQSPLTARPSRPTRVSLAAKIAIAVVLVAELMNVLDHSVVLNAVPTLQTELGAGPAHVQWFTTAYTLMLAVGLTTGGRLGDLYGRRTVFLLGVMVFTVASLFCGLAASPDHLVAARVLQGGGAAIMLPQVLATIHVTLEGESRSRAFGLYGGILSVGSALGPVLSGVLIQADLFGLGWRAIFLVNLPIGVAVLGLGRRYITESTAEKAERLDLPGVALSALAVVLVVFPLTEGPAHGWPWWSLAMLAGGAAVLLLFIFQQRRRQHDSPLLVLSVFGVRTFSAGLAAQFGFGLVSGMFFLTWALYLQRGLGMLPIHSALAFVLLTLGELAGVAVAVRSAGRFGRRLPQAGACVALVAVVVYAFLLTGRQEALTLAEMAVPILVFGAAMGMIGGPLADLALAHVPESQAGAASGVFTTSIHLGMAVGTALTAVVFFSVTGGSLEASVNREAFSGVLWCIGGGFVVLWALLLVQPAGRSATSALVE